MAGNDQPNGDWRQMRRQERQQRRDARRAARRDFFVAPLGALLLIIIGLGLLAQNLGIQLPQRWWALLLLLPAVGSLVAAIRSYRLHGPTIDSWGAIVSGVIFTVLALALFFGLDWGVFWPIVLVLLGAGLLARSYWHP